MVRSGRGLGRTGAGSEPPSQLGCMLLSIRYYPHLSLSLRLTHTRSLCVCARALFTPVSPKPNQASSRCRIADPSSRWLPRQFPVSTVLPAAASPLPWIWLWRGLGPVRRCLMSRPHQDVWSVEARYEQLLSLIAGCGHACMYTPQLALLIQHIACTPQPWTGGRAPTPHKAPTFFISKPIQNFSMHFFLKGQLSIFVSNIFVRN